MEAYNKYKMISKEILLETGKKNGLTNKEHIEKTYFQDIFLFNLYKKTNKFIFKGGTALYKLYGLPRFSEDLDFSLLGGLSLEQAKEIIEDCIKKINYLKIKSIKKTKNSLLIKISCRGILTRYNSLRIDINFKNKVIEGFDIKNYISEYVDVNPFCLRALKLEEIISEKIHSLLNREKARDLFDLFFLLRISKFNKKLVKDKLKIFDMKFSQRKLRENINNIGKAWKKELKPFILVELPDFKSVRDYVFGKVF